MGSQPPLLSFPNVNWVQEENVDHHGTRAVSCIFSDAHLTGVAGQILSLES